MSRQITVDIIGDASKFTKATKEATGSAQKMGTQFGKGLGLGAGISGFNLLSDAASKATEYLSDSIKMAQEEEVGISRLGASLSANVEAWDGNTDAIEKQISAMVKSTGFSDGDMRDSLARLVASTNDVDEAFQLQAVAMDLARFKGIDLAEASQALIKVEGGQYRALKELGIVLEDGATQTEALAAVQKVAGGQMAAYMTTAAGKTEVLNNRLEDMQEEIGVKLMVPLTTATEGMLRFMDALDSESMMTFPERADGVIDVLSALNPAMWTGNINAGLFGDAMAQAAEDASAAEADLALAYDTGSERIGASLDQVEAKSEATKDAVVADNDRIGRSYTNLADILLGQYNDNYDRAMDIQEARADLHAAKTDEDRAEAYQALAEAGALGAKGYEAWADTLERMASKTKGKTHDLLMAAVADIRALQAVGSEPVVVTVNLRTNRSGNVGARASGGSASGLTWVGEEGPELVDLPAGSYVHSNPQSMAMTGRASPSIVVNVGGNIVGPSGIDELMDMMAQRLRLDGV